MVKQAVVSALYNGIAMGEAGYLITSAGLLIGVGLLIECQDFKMF